MRSKALVPYVSSLAKLRRLVAGLHATRDLAQAAKAVDLEDRHIRYYVEGGCFLGFLDQEREPIGITRRGQELLSTPVESDEEASVFRRAVEASGVLDIVPDLLETKAERRSPVEWLRAAGMKESMAKQRGQALERWRPHILLPQKKLQLSDRARYVGARMLERVEVQSFKAFGDRGNRATPAVDTPPLTLLAGPNGAGKTTILQALDIMGMLVRGNIDQLLKAHEWDYADLPHLLSKKQTVTFTVTVRLGGERLEWSLTLGTRLHPGIAEESVFRVGSDGKREALLERHGRNISRRDEGTGEMLPHPPQTLTQSWLSTFDAKEDRASFPGLVALKGWAERITAFWSLDPSLLRAPSRGDAALVGPRGGDLASFLFHLKSRDKSAFQRFEALVRKHYPRLVAIEPKRGEDGLKKLAITERWNGEQASFNAKQVSDGLLRLLAIASIPYWDPTPSVVLLDEVENGLHPHLIAGVAGLLADISKTTQVIATTHSPITLNYVPADSTRLVTRGRAGTVLVTPLTETKGYTRLREHFEPGELWYNVGEERLLAARKRRRGE